jgi:hypothetical protein
VNPVARAELAQALDLLNAEKLDEAMPHFRKVVELGGNVDGVARLIYRDASVKGIRQENWPYALKGIVAAKTLACELYKGLTTGKCALPAGVTRVVRQGITYEMVSAAFDSSGKVRTGIVLVDQFIGTDNPSGQRRRTAVYSPDRSYARRV